MSPEPSGDGFSPAEITHLLQAWRKGDDEALERLAPLVYQDLRALARSHLRRERAGHTLQATALVHEAFFKLQGQRSPWHNREQFFAVASRIMRRVLVDHARARAAMKRGADAPRIELEDSLAVASEARSIDLLDLDRALERLTALEPRLARVVELRYFGGLSVEEAARVLECSDRTVKRDWSFARAWLLRELGP